MNVLHLTLSFERGGRRQAITTLSRQLRGMGAQSDLACLDSMGCAPEEIGGLFGETEALGRRSALDWGALRRLARFCRRRAIDVVHAHDAASQFTAAVALWRRPQTKLIMTFHRSLGFESARWRDRVRNAFAGKRSGAIVTGSRERREHFLRENFVSPRKVIRIPFGIDTDRFRPEASSRAAIRAELGLAEDTFLMGAVGHFGSEKGIDVVVRAFHALARRLPSVRVALVILGDGTGPQKEALHALTRDLPPGQIFFAGFRPHIERWFQAFDLFVHAPRLEAFGLVIAEAMASRLPVVATRIGGIPDIIHSERTGLLVEPDSPNELAEALARLVQDETLRKALVEEAGRVAVAEYGADLYARRHLRLYQDVLAGRQPRGADEETEASMQGPPRRLATPA